MKATRPPVSFHMVGVAAEHFITKWRPPWNRKTGIYRCGQFEYSVITMKYQFYSSMNGWQTIPTSKMKPVKQKTGLKFTMAVEDIYLGQYYLSDNLQKPDKWLMPDIHRPAKSWVSFWADEDGSTGILDMLIFKLSKTENSSVFLTMLTIILLLLIL